MRSSSIDESNEEAASGRSVRKSLVLSFTERYLGLAISVVTTAILARLLTPQDYGVYSIGLVIFGISGVLRDFGMISFLIQERNLTSASVRTAHGISLLIGCLIAGVLVLSSGPIARFYGNDGVRQVLLVLSFNFVLMPFASIVLVLLRREMQFSSILRINVLTIAINSIVTIWLALLGFSFMSMAWGAFAAAVSTCVIASIMRPRQFSLLPSLKEWRRITSYSVVAMTGILVNEIGLRAPELVIGRLLGVEALGIFGRASGLIEIFDRSVTSGVAPVAVATIALRHRSGIEIKHDFLRATTLMTALAWPFFAFLCLMAYPIVRILFGPNWDAAVPVARILCLSGSILALSNLNWLVFQATGTIGKNVMAQIIIQPVALVLIVAAAPFGLGFVAGAVAVSSAVAVCVSYHFIDRLIGISLLRVIAAAAKSGGVAVLSSAIPIAVFSFVTIDANRIWLPFSIAAIGAAAGWLLGIALFRHPLGEEIVVLSQSFGRALLVFVRRLLQATLSRRPETIALAGDAGGTARHRKSRPPL